MGGVPLTARNRMSNSCVVYIHTVIGSSYGTRGPEVGGCLLGSAPLKYGATQRESLKPLCVSSVVPCACDSSHVTPSPTGILQRPEGDKQKGSLLLRCYLISFLKEGKLPGSPPAGICFRPAGKGDEPTPAPTGAQDEGIAVTQDKSSHGSSQGSGKGPSYTPPPHSLLRVLCQIPDQKGGSIRQEKVGGEVWVGWQQSQPQWLGQ